MDTRFFAMGLGLAVAVLMLAGKLAAFFITGSNAILSDAVESIVHIFASGVAAFSLWYSLQAPDKQHPYGHGKIAYFSAGFEGALIGVASLSIFYLAGKALLLGPELAELHIGLLITGALAIVNGFLGGFLVLVGKRANSLVLQANGHHVLTDMWSSAGVVIGVSAVWLTGLAWLDPIVAILVGLNILYTAYKLVRDAFHGLLDQADPETTDRLLACLNNQIAQGHIDAFHQLRHRRTEGVVWIEVHLLVPAEMTIFDAHKRITDVENNLRGLFPGMEAHITSHLEPQQHQDAHPGGHDNASDPFHTEGE